VSETRFATAAGEKPARISRLGAERLLVQLLDEAPVVLTPIAAASPEPVAVAAPLAPPAQLDAFAAEAPFGAALLDGADPFEAAVVEANEAMGVLTGGRARAGVKFGDLIDAATRKEAAGRLAGKRGGPVEVRLALDTPKIAHLYVTSVEGRVVAYLLDVSEQKQLELQLAQSQKMQAIGQLAGGVAHDFNNLLTAIQLRLDELLHRHPVGDPSYEGLNEIRQTGVRAADLVRKLLAFSRKQTVQRETLELGELISEFEVLLRRLLREDVRLETDYGRNLPKVRADKSQLETAVMNLAVNARDALRSHGTADGSVGTVKIRTARLDQAEARRLGYPEAPAEGCALIEVADNGPGIPPEAMAKIFEPFFTTKPVGEGTGLGLATVYGIVKQADGWIHVESAPGKGAAFRVFLPIHVPVAGQEPAAPAVKAKPAARDLSGAGRILFVEDEDAVRGVAARLLRARGYEVIEACDGEEALELAEVHAGQIDLLISDVIMPGLDGPTLLKKARGYLGDAPVMFISGYAEAEFSDLLEGETGVTFLPKPLDIKVLAERVKQQLQAA
jgi:two-component system cell cycle sensor histidine kinase/response regulator CckA